MNSVELNYIYLLMAQYVSNLKIRKKKKKKRQKLEILKTEINYFFASKVFFTILVKEMIIN